MLAAHPRIATLLAVVFGIGAFVALLGAHGILAAVLGATAWFALPDEKPRLTAARGPSRRRSPA